MKSKSLEMKIKLSNISLFIILLHFLGCSPIYYVPKTQNVPLLNHKGNVNFSLLHSEYNYEFQSSLAVTDNVGVILNAAYAEGSYSGEKNLRPSGEGKDVCGELGIGYFERVGNLFIYEIYGLYALGQMENIFPAPMYKNTVGFIRSDYTKYSLQPAFGLASANLEVAVSSKLTYLNFSNIIGNAIFYDKNQIVYLNDNRSNVIVEPALTIRMGFKNVKIQGQLSLSYNLSNRLFYQEEYLLSFGAYFSLFRS